MTINNFWELLAINYTILQSVMKSWLHACIYFQDFSALLFFPPFLMSPTMLKIKRVRAGTESSLSKFKIMSVSNKLRQLPYLSWLHWWHMEFFCKPKQYFFCHRLSGLLVLQGRAPSTHLPPRPTTWQKTSPLRSSSERRAAGHVASGWGLRLYPSAESAGGWALHQTWWARQLGSGTSTGGCGQRSRFGERGPKEKRVLKENKNIKKKN